METECPVVRSASGLDGLAGVARVRSPLRVLSHLYYRLDRWVGEWPLTKVNLKQFISESGIELNGITLNAGNGEIEYDIGAERELCIDLDLHANPDIAADLHHIPLSNESVTTVLAVCVLEHVARPWQVIQEFHRILHTQGKLIVEVPLSNPVHAAPSDFFRFTMEGIDLLLKDNGFRVLRRRITQPASYGIVWLWWNKIKGLNSYPLRFTLLLSLKILSTVLGLRSQRLDSVRAGYDYSQFIVAAEKS